MLHQPIIGGGVYKCLYLPRYHQPRNQSATLILDHSMESPVGWGPVDVRLKPCFKPLSCSGTAPRLRYMDANIRVLRARAPPAFIFPEHLLEAKM